tara:strand:+ start:5654 stop:6727 length:1074 start_codon:yes stop_codon:yes gene_type:complete
MNKKTSHYINQLLDESELFQSNKTTNDSTEIFDFSEETLLITGAAGSIGSGLVRQLLRCNYKKIILVDNAESPSYYLITELELDSTPHLECFLTDIRDEPSMQKLFETFNPTIVFHTAAYKHVPMMEIHPYEAIKLNILATKTLADLAIKHHTKKFIFISTDKAVAPIGVMGMTKYIAECYLKNLNTQNKTRFSITRFGNILGSNGSVAPLFIKQIKSGTPLTITNKNISRYFITKNKACHLILKVATFEKPIHSIFTFDMGQPIKILDLAKTILARFKGIDGAVKIIETTNLRPGEKLHEDLLSKQERLEATAYKDIFSVINTAKANQKLVDFGTLQNITPYQKPSEIKSILKSLL